MYSNELLKGTLTAIILKLLSDNKKMYGYEITTQVKTITGDRIKLTEGSLYPTLHRLEAEGILKTEVQYIGKRMRKFYFIPKESKTAAQAKIRELQGFIETLNMIFNTKISMK